MADHFRRLNVCVKPRPKLRAIAPTSRVCAAHCVPCARPLPKARRKPPRPLTAKRFPSWTRACRRASFTKTPPAATSPASAKGQRPWARRSSSISAKIKGGPEARLYFPAAAFCRVLRFTQFCENFSVEFGPNPEFCILNQLVQYRLNRFNQSSPLCIGQHAEQTGDPQPQRHGYTSPASFIHKQQFRVTFHCEHDCLSLTSVQVVAKLSHTILVFWSVDNDPRGGGRVDHR